MTALVHQLPALSRLGHEDVVLIIGKRRSGKSFQAKRLAASEMRHGARVVAFDPHDEYSVHGRKSQATNLGPLRRRATVEQLLERPELLDDPRLALAVVPRTATRKQLAEDCTDFLGQVRTTGDCTLFLDEVGEYCDRCDDELCSAGTQSRHWGEVGCPIVFVAQRAVLVPKSARDQASVIYSGLQNDPDDLAALNKITGSQDYAERVSRLPKPGLLEWRDTDNPQGA